MLDPNAVTAVIAVNQSISAKGAHLVTLPDTALAMLVREMPTTAIKAEETDYAAAGTILTDLSRGEDHAAVLQRVVGLGSDSVRRTLAFARNTVMPHIYRVIEAYTAEMTKNTNVAMPFDVKRHFAHDAAKTSIAMNFLERWEHAPAVTPVSNVDLGTYTPDEILNLVKISNDGDYNEHIETLLTEDGGRGLKQLSDMLKGIMPITAVDNHFQLPAAVLLQSIVGTPKPGVGMTLTAYTAAVSSMANYAAKNAMAALGRLKTQRVDQALYYGIFQHDAKTIPVVGEVYNDLLEKGFSIDMLFGNELLGRKYQGAALLQPEAMAEMTEVYNRDRAIRQTAHNLDRQRMSRQAILDVLRTDQQAIAAAGEFTVADDSADKSWARLKGFIDSLTVNNTWYSYEPSSMIAATICAVWYAHSDAHRIIDIMFEQGKENPEMPPSEQATMASLQYISEWVASQIGVASKN